MSILVNNLILFLGTVKVYITYVVIFYVLRYLNIILLNVLMTFDFIDVMLFIQINARATYSISFGGSFPELLLPQEMDNCFPNGSLLEDGTSLASGPTQMNWTLYLPKACHPLLLQQHRQKLQKAKKDLNDATAVSCTSTCSFFHGLL